ncbi:hypothetical protein MAMMFC1_03275 [Methylomusa anaerophila]|uniref:Uncharacterized protein n=2 Tax=Methylomusa anaerophila TaxID=1930071 RepID=A0A348AND2_9FIRM|nr:hypothetical protein MAMMFC1_03275 [Methylomusa anaerophila]
MVITNSKNEIFELEASFFKHALQKDAHVFKGCWWQEEDEVREAFAQFGLDTYSLEKDGLLSLVSFSKLYQRGAIYAFTELSLKYTLY